MFFLLLYSIPPTFMYVLGLANNSDNFLVNIKVIYYVNSWLEGNKYETAWSDNRMKKKGEKD